jgi:hypothetical protein
VIAFTNHLLDINQYELDKVRPADIIERQDKEIWVVREQPIDTDLSPRYSYVLEGNFLRIPLFPYMAQEEPALAVALGGKVFFLALAEWQAWRPEHAQRLYVVRVHCVMGRPVQQVPDHLRFWCGLAMQLKERP